MVLTITRTGTQLKQRETSLGSTFAFDGVRATANAEWSASSQVSAADSTPFTFTTSGPTTSVFAVLGHERNGVFA